MNVHNLTEITHVHHRSTLLFITVIEGEIAQISPKGGRP
jgi:hypothetical protein